MKKVKLLVLFFMLIFSMCSEYHQGPSPSIRKSKLIGKWKVEEINNQSYFGKIKFEFKKDGIFTQTLTLNSTEFTTTGQWEWNERKEAIEILINGDKQTWQILRLTNEYFWFEHQTNKIECIKIYR